MSATLKNHLLENNEDAVISGLILFVLDQLEQTAGTPDSYPSLRAIFQRYPLQVVIKEMRNILIALYIPRAADLAHLVMEYHEIMLVPQQEAGGYFSTFIYREALYSTSMAATPLKSLELAQRMVDQLLAGVHLPPSLQEEQKNENSSQTTEASTTVTTVPTSPPTLVPQPDLSFIRIGRITLSIDKILYVKDDSTERYQSVRVGLAGGVDMRLDANPAHNYIHTQEMRFIGEEARAFLLWHQRRTVDLPSLSTMQKQQDDSKESKTESI